MVGQGVKVRRSRAIARRSGQGVQKGPGRRGQGDLGLFAGELGLDGGHPRVEQAGRVPDGTGFLKACKAQTLGRTNAGQ